MNRYEMSWDTPYCCIYVSPIVSCPRSSSLEPIVEPSTIVLGRAEKGMAFGAEQSFPFLPLPKFS